MYRQSEKNLLNSNTSSTCPDNTVNFGPLVAEIGLPVSGTLQISTRFASWQHYCTALFFNSGRQPCFAALSRGRHLYLAGWPSCWGLAHISSLAMHKHYWICSKCNSESKLNIFLHYRNSIKRKIPK